MSNSKPLLKARKDLEISLSPIWFLPILAVLISIWLLVKINMESNIPITIQMTSAQGIVPGKTLIKYRGINAGKVMRLEFAEDLEYVTIHAEIDPELSEFLTSDTKFWVVRAQISLAGVSGLDTVLSGDYIAFRPGKTGDAKRAFMALSSAPAIAEDHPGLRLTLTAENLGSINEGSKLYYRQIPIGEVRAYELAEDSRSVRLSALIEPEYSSLVNQSTVFWNSGGVSVKGSLSGFEVKTESLSAILAGGISLYTPDAEAPTIDTGTLFTLHENYDDAGVGVTIKIAFPSGYDLKSGITKVKFHGINVGHLDSIDISSNEDSGVIAKVIIDPGAEDLLVQDTQFWLVKPDLSLRNISNLETLISGNYITLKTGDSDLSARDYVALDGPPPPDFMDPGLHLVLRANTIGSISLDTPILYKGVEVGRVANVYINDLTEGVSFHAHIRPEYANLINATSRFWNASGLNVAAGLGGVQIRTTSILNILRGGIEFETADPEAEVVDDGHEFRLLDNPMTSENPLKIAIEVPDANSFQPNSTTVRYKGMAAGLLRRLEYQSDSDKVVAHFELNEEFASLIGATSKFWLVAPRLSAAKVEGLDTLFSGPYVTFTPGEGEPNTTFVLQERPAVKQSSDPGLLLELKSTQSRGLQVGSPVLHRQQEVGSVEAVNLSEDGVTVVIYVEPEYVDYISTETRFWNASGVEVKASLAGIEVSTGSLSSVLAGGIAFDTPGDDSGSTVSEGEQFTLYSTASAALRAGQTITIVDSRASGIQVGSAIRFNGLRIGEVTHQKLNDQDQIQLTAVIDTAYESLLREGSRFWLATAKIGLVEQRNIGQLLSGPEIRVHRGEGELQSQFKLTYQTPVTKRLTTGLNLVLESERLGSVKVGNQIYYRQLAIGQVLGVELGQQADKVAIYINIAEPYTPLAKRNSVFWNISGLKVSAGLLSGVDVQAESVETLLAGGIAMATPDDYQGPAQNDDRFTLRQELDEDWLEWAPKIPLSVR